MVGEDCYTCFAAPNVYRLSRSTDVSFGVLPCACSVALVESYPRQPPPVDDVALLEAGAKGRLERGPGERLEGGPVERIAKGPADRLVRGPEERLGGANCNSFHPSCTDDAWFHLSSYLDLAEGLHTQLSRTTDDDDLGLSDLKTLIDMTLFSSGLDMDH